MKIIHPDAQLGEGVEVGPFTTIGQDVVIGDGTWIGSNVSIMDGTRIGKNCRIFPGAIVGAIPQDLKYGCEYSLLEIGDNVTVREYCTLNRGTSAGMLTRIGHNTLVMAYVHVAHDCIIGNNCIIANSVGLAGHIHVGDHVVLGGLTAVHQFVKIGEHAMVGGGSLVRKDVPPFVKAAREPLCYVGINSVGMRRRGFTSDQINHIQDIYRILYVQGHNTSQAVELIEATMDPTVERDRILSFIRNADRGIMKGFRNVNNLDGSPN
jgi:UDP-N-acetylglucosamine acyltransferase